jgi:hypothetical protein
MPLASLTVKTHQDSILAHCKGVGRERIKADIVACPARTLERRTLLSTTRQRALARSLSVEASAPHRMTATAQASGA